MIYEDMLLVVVLYMIDDRSLGRQINWYYCHIMRQQSIMDTDPRIIGLCAFAALK
jgi:hypothetical protein